MYAVMSAASHVFQPHIPMPTIAEIIAAKKAATKGGSVSPPVTQPTAELADTREAIDRIDPPGKSERATAARKNAGIILNQSMPPAMADNRLEVPQELIQPADDLPMCVWLDKGTVWLCMPCADPSLPPIKILRLPWTLWPDMEPQPTQEGDPF